MHVLVTGGLGHIGAALIRHFARVPAIHAVTILDNLSAQRYAALFNLPEGVKYTFLTGDVLQPTDLARALRDVDAVIHLAAITNAEGSFDDPEKVERVNLEGTCEVVRACLRHGVRRLIFPSTTSVYGPMNGIAREDSPRSELRPQSPYATSKLAAEEGVLSATRQNGLEGVVLRMGTVFGPSPGMRFHTAVNKFIFAAVTGQPLTVWSQATELVRPYLALEDGVNAIEFVLERPDVTGEIFNLVTLNARLDTIISAIRKYVPDLEIVYTQTEMLNQVSYKVDDTKIRNLGFAYRGDLSAGIQATIELLGDLRP